MRNDIFYNSKEHGRHTLFSGTKVVQTRFYDDEKVTRLVRKSYFGLFCKSFHVPTLGNGSRNIHWFLDSQRITRVFYHVSPTCRLSLRKRQLQIHRLFGILSLNRLYIQYGAKSKHYKKKLDII